MNKLGIVGGMGPWAGADLAAKLIRECESNCDQDYIPFVLATVPNNTSERSDFLMGRTNITPAYGIVHALKELEMLQASIIGIPCNTSHAPEIYTQILMQIDKLGLQLKILHIVDEVMIHLRCYHPYVENIGILSTVGTRLSNIYPDALEQSGYNALSLNEIQAVKLHEAIYDPEYGLKSRQFPATALACKIVRECADDLIKQGAEVIILACTELPLAIRESLLDGVYIIDSTLVLARAMIKSLEPGKLKPWHLKNPGRETRVELG